MLRLSSLLGLLVLFASFAIAADINGKWTGQVPSRGGEMRDTTFTFKVEGDKLTGTMTGQQGEIPLQDGKVTGDTISFSTTMGNSGVKILFKGTVSGGEIKFTREREGSDQKREFTAKRVTS